MYYSESDDRILASLGSVQNTTSAEWESPSKDPSAWPDYRRDAWQPARFDISGVVGRLEVTQRAHVESHPPDLNRKPSAYEALALPIELGWRSFWTLWRWGQESR
jgi:hypothetical protein